MRVLCSPLYNTWCVVVHNYRKRVVRIDKSRVVESEHIILNGKSCSLNWAIACFDLNAQYIYVGGAYERAPEEKKRGVSQM